MLATFRLSYGTGGLLFAASSAGFMAGSLAGGAAAPRADRRRVLILATAGLLASFLLAWQAPGYTLLLLAVAGAGLSCGLLSTVVTVVTGELHREWRAAALNLLNVFFGLGGIVGPLLASQALVALGGWRPVYGISALPAVLALGAAVALRSLERVSAGEAPPPALGYRGLLGQAAMRPYLLGALLEGATVWGVVHWLVTYLTADRGLDLLAAGRTLSGFWLGTLAGRLLLSRLLLRLRPARVLVWTSALGVGAALALTLPWTPLPFLGLGTLLGMLLAGVFPTLMGLAMDRLPDQSGPIAGALAVASGLGGLVSPELIGLAADGSSLTWGMRLVPVYLLLLTATVAGTGREGEVPVSLKA